MNVKFVYYDRAYKNLRPEIDLEMQRVLSSGDLILKRDVEIFEENLAQFVGKKYAVALSSGTDALVLSLKSQEIGINNKQGLWIRDGISVPSHTFKATAGAVASVGAKPFLIDMDGTFADAYPANYPEHMKGMIITDIAGEVDTIPYDKKEMGFIIEDACQALGAKLNPVSDVQCWSFYPAKILGSFGDAGAITTNNENIAEYAREARNHFKTDNREFGGNHRMDNLAAAYLNVKFKYLPKYLERRKEVAERYLDAFKEMNIGLPKNVKGRVWQDFIIQTNKRNELYDFLKKEGVDTRKNEYPFTPEYPKLPLAAKYEEETLRIPCNAEITDEEVDYVIQKVKEFYEL